MRTMFKTYSCGPCRGDITLFVNEKFGNVIFEKTYRFHCPHCDAFIRTPYDQSELRGMWWKFFNLLGEEELDKQRVKILFDHANRLGWTLEAARARTRMVFWRLI